jgi:transposase-like protein
MVFIENMIHSTPSVPYYKSFDFFPSQTSLGLTKFIEKYNSIFNTKQTYYQTIFNIRFNKTNFIF